MEKQSEELLFYSKELKKDGEEELYHRRRESKGLIRASDIENKKEEVIATQKQINL